ncbi:MULTISPECIES: hypothetical protein [Bacillaceae]|uniref:Uncharacterized protein n=2 Tax=Metabacillus TaxID=2675233 RepID=A0ABS5LGM3_9BACI|nr:MULTISPECIES: hypothetical protein [Bacillaceae]KZZ86123.1 hypothetical protein AS29_002780 [Bacillus sp. SJS]MBS2969902.1 hypothetical protein [Metabacillus flavus]
MRKRFNSYTVPPWVKELRVTAVQFIIPITIFQGIRTLLFPTGFDVLLLAALIFLALAFHMGWL